MTDKAKQKKLKDLKAMINKKKNVKMKLGSEMDPLVCEPVGIHDYDDILGGEPQGRWAVDYGTPGIGKSTFNYYKIGVFQKRGDICLVVDVENSFDKNWATKQGVNLDDLLVIEAQESFEENLKELRALIATHDIMFMLIDSIHGVAVKAELETASGKERDLDKNTQAALPKKMGQFLRMCTPVLGKSKAKMTLIGQVRSSIGQYAAGIELTGGHALKHFATVIRQWIPAAKEHWPVRKIDGADVYVGGAARVKVEKTKINGNVGQHIIVPFLHNVGIGIVQSNVNTAMRMQIVTPTGGAWYQWGEHKLNGKNAVYTLFEQNPEEYHNLMKHLYPEESDGVEQQDK